MKQIAPFLIITIILASLTLTTSVYAEETTTPVLTDIEKHWVKEQIEHAAAKGYVTGFPDGTFRPEDPVTVAQFLAMMFLSLTDERDDGKREWSEATLSRLLVYPKEHFVNYTFDFSQGKPWYTNHVANAKHFLVINDWEYEGRYDESLTRERAAKMVNVMANWFDGAVQEEYAKLAITKMKDYSKFTPGFDRLGAEAMMRGILSGYPDGNFQPKKVITRAEAISVIERINNEELRKPIKVDLSQVPYSMVWGGDGYPKRVHVFPNEDMKKVFDQTVKDIQYAPGATEQNGAAFYYYKDLETMQEGTYYRNHSELWYQDKVYIDMLVSMDGNTYNIQIAGMEDRFERQSETLLRILNVIFAEKGEEVKLLLVESMKKHRAKSLVKVDKVIANRQVLIYSSPGNMDIMSIAISGYSDK